MPLGSRALVGQHLLLLYVVSAQSDMCNCTCKGPGAALTNVEVFRVGAAADTLVLPHNLVELAQLLVHRPLHVKGHVVELGHKGKLSLAGLRLRLQHKLPPCLAAVGVGDAPEDL